MDFLDRNFMSMGGQCVKKHETKCDKNVKFNWLITWSRIRVVGLFSHFLMNPCIMDRCFVETNFCVQLFEKFRFDLSNIALVDLIVRVLWININEIFLPLCGIIVSRSILEVRKFDLSGCNKRKGRKKKRFDYRSVEQRVDGLVETTRDHRRLTLNGLRWDSFDRSIGRSYSWIHISQPQRTRCDLDRSAIEYSLK